MMGRMDKGRPKYREMVNKKREKTEKDRERGGGREGEGEGERGSILKSCWLGCVVDRRVENEEN